MKVFEGEEISATNEAWKHLIYGYSGSGKSRFLTTVGLWVLKQIKEGVIPPEAGKIYVIDFDGGFLTNMNPYPPAYKRMFRVYVPQDLDDIKQIIEDITQNVNDYIDKFNVRPYVLIDNIEHMWQMAQDIWTQKVYGMSMGEVQIEILAQRKTKENNGVEPLTLLTDWNAITQIMKSWRKQLYDSGANIVATSTVKEVTTTYKGTMQLAGVIPDGQKKDRQAYPYHFVSFMFVNAKNVTDDRYKLIQREEIMNHIMLLTKNRATGKLKWWKDTNISFDNYMTWLMKQIKKKEEEFQQSKGDLFEIVKQGLKSEKHQMEMDDDVQKQIEEQEKTVNNILTDIASGTDIEEAIAKSGIEGDTEQDKTVEEKVEEMEDVLGDI